MLYSKYPEVISGLIKKSRLHEIVRQRYKIFTDALNIVNCRSKKMNKMKKICALVLALFLLGCDDDNNPNNCNFLLNVGVNLNVNLNLPQFSQLQFTGNSVRVEGQGNGGIILFSSSGTLLAWDGADPNVAISSCSILEINGPIARSTCEDANEYNLLTGQIVGNNPQPCTLKAYRVDNLGNNQFLVSNF